MSGESARWKLACFTFMDFPWDTQCCFLGLNPVRVCPDAMYDNYQWPRVCLQSERRSVLDYVWIFQEMLPRRYICNIYSYIYIYTGFLLFQSSLELYHFISSSANICLNLHFSWENLRSSSCCKLNSIFWKKDS